MENLVAMCSNLKKNLLKHWLKPVNHTIRCNWGLAYSMFSLQKETRMWQPREPSRISDTRENLPISATKCIVELIRIILVFCASGINKSFEKYCLMHSIFYEHLCLVSQIYLMDKMLFKKLVYFIYSKSKLIFFN